MALRYAELQAWLTLLPRRSRDGYAVLGSDGANCLKNAIGGVTLDAEIVEHQRSAAQELPDLALCLGQRHRLVLRHRERDRIARKYLLAHGCSCT